MPVRTAVRGGVSATLALLLFAVLALANYLAARHFFQRFDLTRNREFTVSEASRKVLAELEDVVSVKVYFSKDLPEQAASIPARVRDLLLELQAYAKGKLRIENVDPAESPETENRVRSLGIPKFPLAVIEQNKQQTVEVYLGLGVFFADQKEVIPVVLDNTNLEYELVRALLRVTRPRKTVGFLTGHQEHDLYGDYRVVGEQLREEYDVETVDLSGGKAVPDKVTTLVVAGPRSPLDERARYEIDQFLMRGGRLLLLLDSFEVDPAQLMARPVDHGLRDQVASYGVRVAPALVADWGANEVVQVPGGGEFGGMPMFYVVQYPLWPKLVPQYISESHPIVNQLPTMVLPWTSPLEPVKDADDRFEVAELARSTEYAVAEEQLFSANPRALAEPAEDRFKQYVVAAAVTGPQRSFFAGKPVPAEPTPAPDAEPTPAPAPEPSPSPTPVPERKEAVESAQLVVVGSSELATDAMLRQRPFQANLVFFQNAVDWLTVGGELIGIRSRVAGEPLLDPKKRELGQRVAPFLNIALVPGLVVAFGLVWRWARNRRRVVLA